MKNKIGLVFYDLAMSCLISFVKRGWVFILLSILLIIVGLVFVIYGAIRYESKEEVKMISKKVSISLCALTLIKLLRRKEEVLDDILI